MLFLSGFENPNKYMILYKQKVVKQFLKKQHILDSHSGCDYKVPTPTKSYLTFKVITIQSLKKPIGQL